MKSAKFVLLAVAAASCAGAGAVELTHRWSFNAADDYTDSVGGEYEIDDKAAFELCDVLKFDSPNAVWLDFVCSCRDGFNAAEGRDFVFGPVANDDVYRTLALYREGEISKEETLARLKIKQLYNQLVFATPMALAFIRFVKSEVVA